MNKEEIQAALNDIDDEAIVFHAFTDYMRDYEVIAATGYRPEHLRYLFRQAVEVEIESMLPPAVWKESLDDRLIDFDAGQGIDGFLWGVKWQSLWPGAGLISPSRRAGLWEAALGIPFHEVTFETNVQKISIVFSDLTVTDVPAGYAPFAVRPDRITGPSADPKP